MYHKRFILVGNQLRRARESRGLSQGALATMTGICPTTISRIERGVSEKPTERVLTALARVLDIDVDFVLSLDPTLCTVCRRRPGRYWVPRKRSFYCAVCFKCRDKGR